MNCPLCHREPPCQHFGHERIGDAHHWYRKPDSIPTPKKDDNWILRFDGACGPDNPGGMACWAFTVYHGQRERYFETGVVGYGEGMSNNVAEYAGANECLKYIREHDFGTVVVQGDSQIVINRLSRRQASKGLCLPYSIEALTTLKSLKANVIFMWVPRERNWRCDELAKEQMRLALAQNHGYKQLSSGNDRRNGKVRATAHPSTTRDLRKTGTECTSKQESLPGLNFA